MKSAKLAKKKKKKSVCEKAKPRSANNANSLPTSCLLNA